MKSTLYASIVALSLAGVGIVLLSTSRHGVGVSPDSVGYISAARNLLAGEGLRCSNGDSYTSWPPLFPLCLAAIGLAGIDPAVAARFLNALALGGITLISGLLLERCLRSKWLVMIGTAAVLLCSLLLGIANMAWTEPVFLLLIVLFVFYVPVFFKKPSVRGLVIVSLLAALCSMQRYTGVALIAGGAILIVLFLPGVTVRRRIQFLALFLAISCMPSALWAARNYWLTSMLSGMERVPSIYGLRGNIIYALDTASKWFVPEGMPVRIRVEIVGLFILLSIAAIMLRRSRFGGPARRDCPYLWPIAVVVLTYVPLTVYTHQIGVLDERLNDRYLSPVSVLVVCFLFIGMDSVIGLLRRVPKVGLVLSAVATGMLAVWLIYPATGVWESTQRQMHDGAGGYMVTSWMESPLVKWLRGHPLDGECYSNVPDVVYALTGMEARASLHRSSDPVLFQDCLSSERNEYLIWFANVRRPYMYDRDEMISMFGLEKLAALSDGAVYRFWSPDERPFSDGPIFSPCEVKGKWSRTFTSDKFGARGVVESWIMKADGAADSTWVLDTGNGGVLRWRASCSYVHAGDGFEFRCQGRATQDGSGAESAYVFTVRGTIEGNTATGTYAVEFANPQWPTADSGTWRVDLARPVYRLYNPAKRRHVYVGVGDETSRPGREWISEGTAFHAYPDGQQPPEAQPVHRFFNRTSNTRLYTLDESQKARLVDQESDVWTYEGIAWYAYREDNHPFGVPPVYQFRASVQGDYLYLYTASESEKNKLINDPTHLWSYDGVAWYALGPDAQ